MPDIVPDDELAVVVNSTGKQAGGTSVHAVEVELEEWTIAGWRSCRITSAVTRAIVSGHTSSHVVVGSEMNVTEIGGAQRVNSVLKSCVLLNPRQQLAQYHFSDGVYSERSLQRRPLTGVEIKPHFPLAWGMSSPEKLLFPKKNH